MAFTQEWKNKGVYRKYFDKLTSKDLIHSNSQLVGKAEFETIKYVIIDFTGITNIGIDDGDVNIATSFNENVNPYNKYIKVALVSNNNELQPLIEKYLENTLILLPHAQQKLFDNITEAQSWVSS